MDLKNDLRGGVESSPLPSPHLPRARRSATSRQEAGSEKSRQEKAVKQHEEPLRPHCLCG